MVNRVGSMFSIFFNTDRVKKYSDIKGSSKFPEFFWNVIQKGILMPPSQYESMFFTISHDNEDLKRTLDAVKVAINVLTHE